MGLLVLRICDRRLEAIEQGLSLVSFRRTALFNAVNALAGRLRHGSFLFFRDSSVTVFEALKRHAFETCDEVKMTIVVSAAELNPDWFKVVVVVESVSFGLFPVQLPVMGHVRRVDRPGVVHVRLGLVLVALIAVLMLVAVSVAFRLGVEEDRVASFLVML